MKITNTKKRGRVPLSRMERMAYVAHERGVLKKTFREIGKALGVTPNMVRVNWLQVQAVQKSLASGNTDNYPDWDLSAQTSNCLRHANLITREQVRKAFVAGQIDPRPYSEHHIRCFGRVCYAELAAWLGLPVPVRLSEVDFSMCPHCGKNRHHPVIKDKKIKSDERPDSYPDWDLSVRASNCMHNQGWLNREQVDEAFLTGQLRHPGYGISKLRNFGWVSYVEVVEWLGYPTPLKGKNSNWHICPHCGKDRRHPVE